MRYPGGKGGAGVVQRIISLMPPHRRYIEPFLGGGAVFYAKRPAEASIVADVDADLIRYHQLQRQPCTEYRVADALDLVPSLNLTVSDLVYLDPPYHPATRAKAKLYNHELDAHHHSLLLAMLQELKCHVILSGYRCAEYDAALASWWSEDYRTMTRGGPRVETVWCNFLPGAAFHDTRYLGGNFRERERIKRKRDRWASRFAAMPAAERAVIAEALALANQQQILSTEPARVASHTASP
ncbi:SAM-dependent methyltransferase [Solimonas fluminis]|uniref:site-specific DNA-methyltransferase (adenine-specific) n=1 Tax=Solimonas fluminis TaxID=2086571 RepID=A0A2S5TCJ9_9GAMM|nr:DNA adenine methylase [Solimonas fluminis]PPE72721.1 SAM-dependent methyltransferase [Solimonas fluminis]